MGIAIKIVKAKKSELSKLGKLLGIPRKVGESPKSYKKRLFQSLPSGEVLDACNWVKEREQLVAELEKLVLS